MNIVLLGATGFVGGHLVPRLARDRHRQVVVARRVDRGRGLQVSPGVTRAVGDPHDPAFLRRTLAGADAAINLVGILNERGRGGRGFERAHVDLVRGLVGACRETGTRRILQISALHAGEGESHYLRTKGEAEELLRGADDLEVTIFQPSVIFGPDDSFTRRFAGLLKFLPVLPLACADAPMQPVAIQNVVEAVATALQRADTVGRTYPLVGPEVFAFGDIVRLVAARLGGRRWVPGLPPSLSRLQAMVMDFVPGKPFSTDNYRSLQVPNVSERNGLLELGIRPLSLRAELPTYLRGSLRQERLAEWRRAARR